jgi:hypothetical protein
MERYRNAGGDSGVYAYEIATNHITVTFSGTSVPTLTAIERQAVAMLSK